MKTATAPQKIQELERELARVKSFVIGLAGTDPEGTYRPELAGRLLRAEKSGVANSDWTATSLDR